MRITPFHPTFPIFLAPGTQDETFAIWNYTSMKQLVSISRHKSRVLCAKFHPKKNLIVSSGREGTIILWRFDSLAEKLSFGEGDKITDADVKIFKFLTLASEKVYWVSFHPTSGLIISCDDKYTIKIWRYEEQDLKHKCLYSKPECVEVHSKTNQIVSSCYKQKFTVLDCDGNIIDSFYRDDWSPRVLDCHKTLPLVAVAGYYSLIIFALKKHKNEVQVLYK